MTVAPSFFILWWSYYIYCSRCCRWLGAVVCKVFRQPMSGATAKQIFSTHAYCYKNKDLNHLKCRSFLLALKFYACFCSLFASVFAIVCLHWSVRLPTTAPLPKDGNRQPANCIASLTRNNIVEIGLSTLYQIVWAFLCYYPEVL